MVNFWIDGLRCPDCRCPLATERSGVSGVRCTGCGREFESYQGILDLLPASVTHREEKEKEKTGWTRKTEDAQAKGWDPEAEHFLSLPNYPHPYYQAAAWYLRIILEYGKPWDGKRVLELGAAECWGTRCFAEAGCQAAALDYDATRMRKGQILLDHLPITFARFTGDAENLPFADNSLDCVFCCSVLHHFFDLPKAVREIARTLRPGGTFFAFHEAFHPPYYTREKILAMSEDTGPNIEMGINESSYTLRFYRNAFRRAGLKLQVLHPRWDVKENGDSLTVAPGVGVLGNPSYIPEMFRRRAWRKDMVGFLSRVVLRSGLWRLGTHPRIFSLLRFPILNWTTKDKLLIGRKTG